MVNGDGIRRAFHDFINGMAEIAKAFGDTGRVINKMIHRHSEDAARGVAENAIQVCLFAEHF
jgi:hypothetical protein